MSDVIGFNPLIHHTCITNPTFPDFVLLIGCMFSGKTTELERQVHRYATTKTCLVVNHVKDADRINEERLLDAKEPIVIKSGDISEISSHKGSKITAIFANSLEDQVLYSEFYHNADLIAIDEAQFFDHTDLELFIRKARYDDHKIIIVAGLDSDSDGLHFMDFNFLIPHCTKLKKLTAKCQMSGCYNSAHHTFANFQKTYKVQINTKGYIPLCDAHYFELMKQ
ncbi:MAG: hypothetical protein PHN45_00150 [Methylococcales bacterium]|nr:hypothetical protein [Methylococcales bacterium]